MAETLALRAVKDIVALLKADAAVTALVPAASIRLDPMSVPQDASALPAICVRLGDEEQVGPLTISRIEQAVGIEVRIFSALAGADPIDAAEALRAAVYTSIMGVAALDGGAQIVDAPATAREYEAAEVNLQTTALLLRARIQHAWSDLTA